jgi:8-oxo-dGTP pyrophosphatase MutT (NUDIX family)
VSRRTGRTVHYGDCTVRVGTSAGADDPPHGVVAVIESAGRYLLIKRGPDVSAPGWWCLPGGGIEPGESEALALVRELREELGIDTVPVRPLWRAVTAWGVDLAWWETRWDATGAIRPDPGEVAEVSWFTTAEALKLRRLLGSNIAFFEALPRLRSAEPR